MFVLNDFNKISIHSRIFLPIYKGINVANLSIDAIDTNMIIYKKILVKDSINFERM